MNLIEGDFKVQEYVSFDDSIQISPSISSGDELILNCVQNHLERVAENAILKETDQINDIFANKISDARNIILFRSISNDSKPKRFFSQIESHHFFDL